MSEEISAYDVAYWRDRCQNAEAELGQSRFAAVAYRRVLTVISHVGDVESARNVAAEMLRRTDAGAALLAELEAGQKVVEAADSGEWHLSEDCSVEGRADDCDLCQALVAYNKVKQ